ncbi:MAG: LCP family protein [Acidimicrobiia bacterium]|nr:LCP family protein [Acidimicrobiia bacterium]
MRDGMTRHVALVALGLILLAGACSASEATESTLAPPTTAASTTTTTVATTTAAPAPSSTVPSTSLAGPNSNLTEGEATSTSTTTTTTTTTQPPRIWDGVDQLDILLLGSDAGVGRTGTRTDTVILLSIDPETGDAAMFSVPRNLTEAPLPEGMGIWDCNCFPDIITHLWANAEWFPDAFPGPQEPPINALKAAVGLVFDVEVDYYAKVDLAAFVGLFDALGGVFINAPVRIYDPSYPHEDGSFESIAIEAGEQLLDGHDALAYGRIRYNSGDFARMHRQRCLLGSLLENTDPAELAEDSFSAAVTQFVETDIPIDAIGDFVELFSRMERDRVATVRITRYNYGTTGHAGYQIYDLDQIREDARLLLADPTLRLETLDGDSWEDICSQSFD